MIKRLIGILIALGAIAVIVFTCLGSGTYRSMIFDAKAPARQTVPAPKPQPVFVPADSTAVR